MGTASCDKQLATVRALLLCGRNRARFLFGPVHGKTRDDEGSDADADADSYEVGECLQLDLLCRSPIVADGIREAMGRCRSRSTGEVHGAPQSESTGGVYAIFDYRAAER